MTPPAVSMPSDSGVTSSSSRSCTCRRHKPWLLTANPTAKTRCNMFELGYAVVAASLHVG